MTRTSPPGGTERERPPARHRNPYLDVLGRRGALAFSSAALIGRMSMSMYGLGTVLLIASLTGRYGLAGTVAAAGSVGYAVFAPVAAKLVDRFGQGRVLMRQGTIFAVCTTIFIGCVELRAPVGVLIGTGVLAGACMPSLGSMVRARWSALIGDDARSLHAAFSLESVNDEVIFVIGPALVTLLATQFLPASGIGAAALLCTVGTLLFAAQRGTEPPTAGSLSAGTWRTWPRRIGLGSLPVAGLITLAPAFLLLGAMFASMDLSTVAFATDLGHRPVAGLILGTFALGSAVGGLWYGSRHWRAPLGRRFTITEASAVLGVSTFCAMPGLLALDAVGFIAGLSIAPTLIAGYAILEVQAPRHRRTEAMAWLSSTISVGVALGSAIVGHVIDARGARFGFGFAAVCGVAAVAVSLAGRRRLATPG